MKRICTKCGEEKEDSTNFQFRKEQGRYRTICVKCCSESGLRNKITKMKVSNEYYWKIRVNSANHAAYRAKKRYGQLAGKINHLEMMNLYDSNPFCYYCKVEVVKEECEIEHTTPLSRGGEHVISNITICCKDCNQLKGTRTDDEFKIFLKKYVNRFNAAAV